MCRWRSKEIWPQLVLLRHVGGWFGKIWRGWGAGMSGAAFVVVSWRPEGTFEVFCSAWRSVEYVRVHNCNASKVMNLIDVPVVKASNLGPALILERWQKK